MVEISKQGTALTMLLYIYIHTIKGFLFNSVCTCVCISIYPLYIYMYTILYHGNSVGIQWKYNDITGGRITFHQNMGLNVRMNKPIWVLIWDTMIGC